MLAPYQIRYSQDSISNTFGDNTDHAGQYIGETLDEIVMAIIQVMLVSISEKL